MKRVRIPINTLKEIIVNEYNKIVFGNSLNENTTPITRDQMIHKIMNSKGSVFTVNFTKKDGTERIMNARLGVKKHLKGGSLPYNAVEHGLIPVFDMQLGAYRMINKNTINAIRIGGISYVVTD
jgi:hypothetical protein